MRDEMLKADREETFGQLSRRSFLGACGMGACGLVALGLGACSARGTLWETEPDGVSTATGARTFEEIDASKVLRVGVLSDMYPMSAVDSEGNYRGYEIFYAGKIAESWGLISEYHALDSQDRKSALESGEVDIVIAEFSQDEAPGELLFAPSYVRTTQALIVSQGENTQVDEAAAVTGEVVAATGTAAARAVESAGRMLKECTSYSVAERVFLEGGVAAFAADYIYATAWVEDHPGYVVSQVGLGGWRECAAAVAMGNEELQKQLSKLTSDLGGTDFFTYAYRHFLISHFGDDFDYTTLVIEGGRPLQK